MKAKTQNGFNGYVPVPKVQLQFQDPTKKAGMFDNHVDKLFPIARPEPVKAGKK